MEQRPQILLSRVTEDAGQVRTGFAPVLAEVSETAALVAASGPLVVSGHVQKERFHAERPKVVSQQRLHGVRPQALTQPVRPKADAQNRAARIPVDLPEADLANQHAGPVIDRELP